MTLQALIVRRASRTARVAGILHRGRLIIRGSIIQATASTEEGHRTLARDVEQGPAKRR